MAPKYVQCSQYPRPFASQLRKLVKIVSARRRLLVDHQPLFLESPKEIEDKRERKPNVLGDFATKVGAAVQQELQDDRLNVRVAYAQLRQRGRRQRQKLAVRVVSCSRRGRRSLGRLSLLIPRRGELPRYRSRSAGRPSLA